MKYREFTTPEITVSEADYNRFKLLGQEYHCRPEVPAGILLDLAGAGGQNADSIPALMNFFEAAIVPEDFERFQKAIRDPKTVVPIGTLTEIVNWLAEIYSDRPTGGNSSASSATQSSGVGSTEVPSPEVVTYVRSPEAAPAPTSNGG